MLTVIAVAAVIGLAAGLAAYVEIRAARAAIEWMRGQR